MTIKDEMPPLAGESETPGNVRPISAIRLCAAFTLVLLGLWETCFYGYFGLGDEPGGWPLFTGLCAGTLTMLVLVWACSNKPNAPRFLVALRRISYPMLACIGIATACLGTDMGGIVILQYLCSILTWACIALCLHSCICAFSTLDLTHRIWCGAIAAAIIACLQQLPAKLPALLDFGLLTALISLVSIVASSALGARLADEALAKQACPVEVPADLQLTQPAAFLSLTNRLFMIMLAFGFPVSLAFYFGVDSGYTSPTALSAVPLTVLAVIALMRKGRISLDSLFLLTFVMAAGAFLSIGFVQGESMLISTALFGASETCFYALMATLLASIARQNPQNAPAAVAWGIALFMTSWGIAGFLFDHLAHVFIQEVPLMVFPLAWAFVTFGVLCLHRFSIDDTVSAIEEVRKITPLGTKNMKGEDEAPCEPMPTPEGNGDSFISLQLHRKLAEIASAAQLTERETEIFELLVRGRNARYLQDQLGITRNTAKSHIAHIYAKLGVHSQQELIDFVDQPE